MTAPTTAERKTFEAAGLYHSIGEFGERFSIRARVTSATILDPAEVKGAATYQYGPAVFQATKLRAGDWLVQCFDFPSTAGETRADKLAAFLKSGDKIHESRIGAGLQPIVLLHMFAIMAASCAVDIPHAKRVLKEFQPGELNA